MSAPSPALPPPPGKKPFSPHPESLARWNTVCVSVCLSITTVLFFLRSYVRLFIKRSWILEDYLVLVSWAGLVTYCALMTTVMHRHGGVHGWDLAIADVHEAIYWFNATSIEYAPIILDTKIAILLLYRRIFLPHRGSTFDWVLRIFIVVLTGFYFATALVKIWECSPREKIWNKSVPGRCVNISSLLNTSGLFNSITDIMILLVPIKSIWKLQMSTRRKVGVVAIFTLGFCAPVFSTIGFVVRLQISSSPDVTYNYPEILLWAAAEISTGLICVCIPELKAFARYRRPSKPSDSILNGAATIRRTRPYDTMKHGSLDEQALWDGIKLKDARSFTDIGVFEGFPAAVTTDIEGGVELPKGMSREETLPAEGEVDNPALDTEKPARRVGIFTSIKMEQSST